MTQVSQRVVVTTVPRDMDRALVGMIGTVVSHNAMFYGVRIDNLPENGQHAGKTVHLQAPEVKPVEWLDVWHRDGFGAGLRVRVMARGCPVRGKYGTVREVERARVKVEIGSRVGNISGWFAFDELQVLA